MKTSKTLFKILCALLLCSCISKQKNESRAALYLQMGNDYLDHNDYPEALKNFQIADQLAPNNPMILNSLGMLYFHREKFETSLDDLSRAIQLAPKYTDAHTNYARVLIAMAQYDRAIHELQNVLKDLTYEKQDKAYTNLGMAYMRKNNFVKAKALFLKALAINRNYCPAYNLYGQTLLEMKNPESADNVFNQALRICETGLEELNYFSALTNYQLGKGAEAKHRLQEIIKLNPASEYAEKAQKLMTALEQVQK